MSNDVVEPDRRQVPQRYFNYILQYGLPATLFYPMHGVIHVSLSSDEAESDRCQVPQQHFDNVLPYIRAGVNRSSYHTTLLATLVPTLLSISLLSLGVEPW